MACLFPRAVGMKSFGDRLRAARVAVGMTQEQLGFALGVTKSSVSAWENNRETPSFRLLPELRSVLRHSLDELVCGVAGTTADGHAGEPGELHVRSSGERALLLRYRELPPKRREALLELLRPAK